MESHLRKLLTDYGPVSILWFDGLANHAKYDPPRFHRLVHRLSPTTLINDRLGDGYDFVTPEQFIPQAGIPVRTGQPPAGNGPESERFFRAVLALFKMPGIRCVMRRQLQKYAEGQIELTPVPQEPYPAPERFQPWETCMTIGQSWAYNPSETVWKAPGTLVRNLVEVVSRGGNYLLNVGPTDRGTFPPEAVARLQYVGRWMSAHSEAIYGSEYTSLQGRPWGRATRKDDRVYLHLFTWPTDRRLVIESFPDIAQRVSLMAGDPLLFVQSAQRLEITLPSHAPDPDVSVLAVEVS
jgi:alpha-L-fucosidase